MGASGFVRMTRPSFSELTEQEQSNFGNGVGPYWAPTFFREFVTNTANWFFEDASWRHHDFGYVVGGDRWDRARCDWEFYTAMIKDSLSQDHWLPIFPALLISTVFYLAVRVFGQMGSFEYRNTYASIEEVKQAYRKDH